MVPTGFLPDLKNPNYPCDTDRPTAVGEYLSTRNFLERGEHVRRLTPAETPGRNATWRVETTARSFVVKQFCPWPANGRPAPAPEDRFKAECQFHRTARIAGTVGRALPTLLHHDCRAGCAIFEDVGEGNATSAPLTVADAEALAWFLVSLHHHTQSVPAVARYHSPEVVGWQMAHLFQQSRTGRRGEPGRWLTRFAALSERTRHALEDAQAALGREGSSLVHGHFMASNWVRAADGRLRVVDAEFSFFGPPEFDAGAFIASLLYTRQPVEVVRAGLAVLNGGCLHYHARNTVAFAAAHLCDLLETRNDAHAPRGAAATALLRRLARAIELASLEAIVPPRS